jgi:hypothetical protein
MVVENHSASLAAACFGTGRAIPGFCQNCGSKVREQLLTRGEVCMSGIDSSEMLLADSGSAKITGDDQEISGTLAEQIGKLSNSCPLKVIRTRFPTDRERLTPTGNSLPTAPMLHDACGRSTMFDRIE